MDDKFQRNSITSTGGSSDLSGLARNGSISLLSKWNKDI